MTLPWWHLARRKGEKGNDGTKEFSYRGSSLPPSRSKIENHTKFLLAVKVKASVQPVFIIRGENGLRPCPLQACSVGRQARTFQFENITWVRE
jgi:hypothetical protein